MSRTVQILLALLVCSMGVVAQSIPVDGYAAVVNDRVITIGDVLGFVQPVHEQLRMSYEDRELEMKLQEAFDGGRDTLIEKALILEEFEAMEGTMPDRAVDEHINSIIQERFNNDRAAFLEALGGERMTLEEWREQIKEQLIVTVLRRQSISARIAVRPKAILALYEANQDEYRIPAKVQLRMIVINKGETGAEQMVKREEAEGVLQTLRDGADFAKTAMDVSEGQKANDGGDWGWIEPRTLRAELADAVSAMESGEISDVLEAGDAFYILMAEGKREESVRTLESVRRELERELRFKEENKQYDAWIERLKAKYYVKVF